MASSEDTIEQRWVRLKPDHPADAAATPGHTKACTRAVVERVTKRVGHAARSVQVLPNLGAFLVSASPAFIQELSNQPEIESTRPTNEPISLIRPVESHEVTLQPARAKSRRKTVKRRQR